VTDRDDALIGALLRTEFPALYLRLGEDERVVDLNLHTETLLGPSARGALLSQLLTNFDSRSSARTLSAEPGPHVLNFLTAAGLPYTVTCAVRRLSTGMILVGGADPDDQELFRRELLHNTQALANRTREAQRANAELERLTTLKTRFVGMAAHDLRSPLTTIGIVAEGLQAELEPGLREDATTIVNAAEFMGRMVANFLDVALVDTGHLELKRAPARLAEVVERALRLATPLARRRAMKIQTHSSCPELELSLDAARIQQVLMNLLNNALEHSPAGATVTIGVERDESSIRLQVQDQGPGIPPEVHDNLFTAFVHAEGKSQGERSIGLGLAIAREIARAHGGELSARSSSSGSTFTLSLPIEQPK
jgi:signal transduction histidine kinase